MVLARASKIASRKQEENGYSLVDTIGMLSFAIVMILFIFAMNILLSFKSENESTMQSSMQDNLKKIAFAVDESLESQEKEKLIVENGGKLPYLTLSVSSKTSMKNWFTNDRALTGTLIVKDKQTLVELGYHRNTYYDIKVGSDNYTIQAYKVNSKYDSKELVMQYDSNTKAIEKIVP